MRERMVLCPVCWTPPNMPPRTRVPLCSICDGSGSIGTVLEGESMTWAALIAVLVQLFGPTLLAWLQQLLKQTEHQMGVMPAQTSVAIHDVFDTARKSIAWWKPWQWGRYATIGIAERIALSHAAELELAARGAAAAPELSGAEYEALTGG